MIKSRRSYNSDEDSVPDYDSDDHYNPDEDNDEDNDKDNDKNKNNIIIMFNLLLEKEYEIGTKNIDVNKFHFLKNKNAMILAFDETIRDNSSPFEDNYLWTSINQTKYIIEYLVINKCFTDSVDKELLSYFLHIVEKTKPEFDLEDINIYDDDFKNYYNNKKICIARNDIEDNHEDDYDDDHEYDHEDYHEDDHRDDYDDDNGWREGMNDDDHEDEHDDNGWNEHDEYGEDDDNKLNEDELYYLTGWTEHAILIFIKKISHNNYELGVINAGIGSTIIGNDDEFCNGIIIFNNISYILIKNFFIKYTIFIINIANETDFNNYISYYSFYFILFR